MSQLSHKLQQLPILMEDRAYKKMRQICKEPKMNKNIRIAKDLIRIAKILTASKIEDYLLPGKTINSAFRKTECESSIYQKSSDTYLITFCGYIEMDMTTLIEGYDDYTVSGMHSIERIVSQNLGEIINALIYDNHFAAFPNMTVKECTYDRRLTAANTTGVTFEAETIVDRSTAIEMEHNYNFDTIVNGYYYDSNGKECTREDIGLAEDDE